MFLIFEENTGRVQVVNDRYIDYIGYDDAKEIFSVETNNYYWEITQEQYHAMIHAIARATSDKISIDCRIPVNKLREIE